MLGIIQLTLLKKIAHNVVKDKSTMELMKVLSNMYEKASANNKVFLMMKLFHLKMGEGALMATYLNKFNIIINQLSFVEIDFNNKVHVLILLMSLPNSWEPMRAVISNSIGNSKLNFNDARNHIFV